MADIKDVTIDKLAWQGDGVGAIERQPIFVPFTLEGERVEVDVVSEKGGVLRGKVKTLLSPSSDRVTPICKHFGTCGGCSLQHFKTEEYLAWKRDMVASAFHRRGIEIEVAPVISPQGKRRRAVFTAKHRRGGVHIGFHEANAHALVEISECPVLQPDIVAALPRLRDVLGALTAKDDELRVTVTQTNNGLDVAVSEAVGKLTALTRAQLARDAARANLARYSLNGDVIFESAPPSLTFGAAEVVIPPGVFLQAMADAEKFIANVILENTGKVKNVADLFSGVGAFTFPLAKKAKVLAVDLDQEAIAAIRSGSKTAQGLKPIEARVRDLFHEPLSAMELNDFDCVVFDPPRAGANAQARMLAKSKVKTVIAVSCWPETLAQDARTLIDGGYTLESVTPIDQFHYTPHVEAVAVFRR